MQCGCSRFLAGTLASGAMKSLATHDISSFSVFKLAGSPLLHKSSTAIRNPRPSEEHFEKLAAFADETGRLHGRQLSAAANYFAAHPSPHANPDAPAILNVHLFFATALTVFGRAQGFLTVADLRNLFIEARYPEGWVVRRWGLSSVLRRLFSWRTYKNSPGASPAPAVEVTPQAETVTGAAAVAGGGGGGSGNSGRNCSRERSGISGKRLGLSLVRGWGVSGRARVGLGDGRQEPAERRAETTGGSGESRRPRRVTRRRDKSRGGRASGK